jgi:hypothetical protein
MSSSLAYVSLFLSICSFIFLVVACSGYTSSGSIVESSYWIYYDEKSYKNDLDIEVWFGLKGFYGSTNDSNYMYTNYDSNTCSSKLLSNSDHICYRCNLLGKDTLILLSISCCLTFGCIITNAINAINEEVTVKIAGATMSFLSFILSLVGICIFMTTCYNAIDRLVYVEGEKLHYGPGASIGVVGFLCNLITFVLTLANIYWGSNSTVPPMSYQT